MKSAILRRVHSAQKSGFDNSEVIRMKWFLVRLFFIFAGVVAGGIAGGLTLMNYFGNHLTHIQMFGVRGYEVGFKIGAITGSLAGGVIGYILPVALLKYDQRQ